MTKAQIEQCGKIAHHYEPTGQVHPEIVNFAIVEEIERRYKGAKIKRNRRGGQ